MADTQPLAPTDAELTAIYKAANGEDTGKAQPLTTQHIFRAMRAAIAKWGAQPVVHEPRYRLLEPGIDRIEANDEFLMDDTRTWETDAGGIFVGMLYGNVFRPARRAKEAAHGITPPDLVARMEALACPAGMDTERFERSKKIKARIWRHEVSASMSGIEYCEPEASWIADQLAKP